MPVSDAQRRAKNKYDAKHATVLGCKMRKEDAEKFKATCEAAGTNPNAVFRKAVDDFMAAHSDMKSPDGDPSGQ